VPEEVARAWLADPRLDHVAAHEVGEGVDGHGTADAAHDEALVSRVRMLVSSERRTSAELVAHLSVLDTRDVHLREGYPSLFVYCRDAPGLSEHETYNRIEMARAVRASPGDPGAARVGSCPPPGRRP
jgi:hypothetical protein